MRLIDADNLKIPNDAPYKASVKRVVAQQPTVEAVPVVRCKNCTRWGTGAAGEAAHVKCCEFGKYMVGENGYCVYGELRSRKKV